MKDKKSGWKREKNQEKEKKMEKRGKNQKNKGKLGRKAKIGKVLSLCHSWQRELAMSPRTVVLMLEMSSQQCPTGEESKTIAHQRLPYNLVITKKFGNQKKLFHQVQQ